MGCQLEVVKFRDLIPVSAIPRLVPNTTTTTIELFGEDFSKVDQIFINEILVPEFIIINKNTVWAQFPEGVDTVQNIEVLSSGFTRTAVGSKMSFQIGQRTKKVTGILKLTQLFTKWMLQSPGSDIFNPTNGGGLQRVVGKITTSKRMEPAMAMVTRAIDQTSEQIRTSQIMVGRIPMDEKLLSAGLLGVNIFEETMEAAARVRIVSMAGEAAISALIL